MVLAEYDSSNFGGMFAIYQKKMSVSITFDKIAKLNVLLVMSIPLAKRQV